MARQVGTQISFLPSFTPPASVLGSNVQMSQSKNAYRYANTKYEPFPFHNQTTIVLAKEERRPEQPQSILVFDLIFALKTPGWSMPLTKP